jgi:hypothetical protein
MGEEQRFSAEFLAAARGKNSAIAAMCRTVFPFATLCRSVAIRCFLIALHPCTVVS